MKWYEQRWVNHRDWILENLELLGLSEEEIIVTLCIDFMNEYQIDITMESLSKKTGMTSQQVNAVISSLCAKQYLSIQAGHKKVIFSLKGLFETDTAREKSILDQSVFDTFETAFKRPLSHVEMETITQWLKNTDKKVILSALREACAYQKTSIAYIGKILSEWEKNGRNVAIENKE